MMPTKTPSTAPLLSSCSPMVGAQVPALRVGGIVGKIVGTALTVGSLVGSFVGLGVGLNVGAVGIALGGPVLVMVGSEVGGSVAPHVQPSQSHPMSASSSSHVLPRLATYQSQL